MTQLPTGSLARFALGPRLKELRTRAGLTLKDVEARAEEMSHSKLSRIERGQGTPRLMDLEQLGRLYHADEATVQELKELARATKVPSWFRSYADVVSENFRKYIELEEQASAFSWYEIANVPGLLQTRDFARMVMANQRRTGYNMLTDDKLERRLEVRLKRQEILTREVPAVLDVVLDEAVLTKTYGEPQVLAGQLEHFLELTKLPNIDIRVMLPDRAHAGLATGQFIILDFPEVEPVQLHCCVYIDGLVNFTLTAAPEDVDLFRTSWTDMRKCALSSGESVAVIGRRLKDLRRQL